MIYLHTVYRFRNRDRESVANLINTLSNGEAGAIPINEDSNSLEISEKPITDTGQVTTSPSLEDEAVQENGIHMDEINDKQLPNGKSDEFEDEQDQDQDQEQDQDNVNEGENDEEDIDAEEDMTNDESSKQITEEDDSQEMVQTPSIESRCTNASPPLEMTNLKTMSASVDTTPVEDTRRKEVTDETSAASLASESKAEVTHRPTALTIKDDVKAESEGSMPLKSIETPVITSPLKLVNIAELKQEEKLTSPTTPTAAPLNVAKHGKVDETTDTVVKAHEKLPGKNSGLPYSNADSIPVGYSKLSVKPIDQLAANLVRMQSEKLEKPSGTKSLEMIAESLARSSSGVLGNMVNGGEEDRLPQDFCARNQSEKSALRGHRGIDLSTSPRGWENANEQNRPMDFSGIDLSSRKSGKTVDLPSSGYRTPDFQHREMDLSTKKSNKPPPEVSNVPYDARSVMMRNHAMVADLSKRQMPFTAYETPYHNVARLPAKDEHRLASYTILPDPSKITSLRMNTASLKRPLEGDDAQPDTLKRIRADVIPIRGSMDKRSMMSSSNWREEVGEAIEEPTMMIQGEGSGSDCDAVNPIVGEAIEEPTIFFYGEGSGAECDTGNPGDDASTDNKESNESKNEPDSASATLSQNKILTEDEVSTDSIVSSKTPVKLNRNYPQSNVSDNCQIVDSMQEKPKFKPTLGVQIIPKSTTGPVKRLSRWDVGKPEEKTECDSSIISNEGDISVKENANKRDERNNTEQRLSSMDAELTKTECEDSAGVSRASEADGSFVNTEKGTIEDSVGSRIPTEEADAKVEEGKDSKIQEFTQCDSSVSSCQADTSQRLESSTNSEATVDSANIPSILDSSSVVSREESDTFEMADNECKPLATSPPRFFFGPNCISYISKSDELESQPEQSSIIKADTVQYECVSSSKSADDTTCKTENFDMTQTNNNSLKTDLFTAESDGVSHGSNSDDVEKVEELSNVLNQQISMAVDNSKDPNDETDCSVSNLSRAQDQMAIIESSVQESFYISKKIEESNDSKSTPSSSTEAATESINDTTMIEKDPVKISSDVVQPEESGIVEPLQCDPFSDSEKPINVESQENSFHKLNDVTLQLNEADERGKSPADCCKSEDDYQSINTDVYKEDQERVESVTTAHSSPSSFTQNLQTELTDLREFDNANNSNELLDSSSSTACTDYQEANRSTAHDVFEKYQTLQKNDLDLAADNCDKQSDKNDNFSEIDGQEDHSTDTENEKVKGLTGSDADSMCVNYDRSSERTDAMSDVGMQDDGSGDSEEIKEKALNDVQVNDTVAGINLETHLSENFVVINSESARESDNLVPTISSSDDTYVQGSSFQESESLEIQDKKTENVSFTADEASAFNILPATMPETNLFELSESRTETTKEMSFDLGQSTNEYADDVSENPSSCVDQDSTEKMIIDDRASDSNEFSKEIDEETTTNDEQRIAHQVSLKPEREQDSILTNVESCPITTETEVSTTEKSEIDREIENDNDFQQSTEDDENRTCSSDKQAMLITEDAREIDKSEEITAGVETSKIETTTESVVNSEIENNVLNVTSQESQKKVTSDKSQSLVANYDSSDSNDEGSDDVFEPDVPKQASDSKDDVVSLVQQEPSEELHKKLIVKEDEINLVSNVPQEQSIIEQQMEQLPKINETSNQDASVLDQVVTINTKETLANEMQVKSACNDVEYTNDELLPSLNKDEFEKEPDVCDISVTEHSEASDAKFEVVSEASDAKFEVLSEMSEVEVAPVMTQEAIEPVSCKSLETTVCYNEKSKEHFNNLVDNVKIVQEAQDIVEEMEKTDLMSQEADDFKKDDANKFEKSSFARESVEFNDVDSQMIGLSHSKDQHVTNVAEEANINLDAENIAESKDATSERVIEELSITQPHERSKEHVEEYNKDDKYDAKLPEECLTKPFEGVNLPVQADIMPVKLDNVLTADKSPIKTKDTSLEGSVTSSSLSYPNSISTKVENINNVDSCNNQNEPFDINVSVSKITDNFSKNLPSSATDELITFPIQEIVSEISSINSDTKKEVSKRLNDISNVEDIPPTKSKPPFLEVIDKMPKNLVNVDVQAPKTPDTFKQITKLESKIEDEEKASAISTTQLFQNDFDMINDSAVTTLINEPRKVDDAIEKIESSEVQSIEMKEASDDSTGIDNESIFNVPSEEVDPLACADDEALKNITEDTSDIASKISIRVKPVTELVYEGWKLDSTTETPKISRKRRNSAHESNSEDGTAKQEEDEEMVGGKRIKLRAKRVSDKGLRKSVEESRVMVISSEDEAMKCEAVDNTVEEHVKDPNNDANVMHVTVIDKKSRGRPRGRRRRGFRNAGRPNRPKIRDIQAGQMPEVSPGVHPDGTPNDSLNSTPAAQKKRKKRKYIYTYIIIAD